MYYNELFFFYNQGEKSDDPISPAYIPTLFSFTSSKRERELQHSLRRYNAAKHREKCRGAEHSSSDAATDTSSDENSDVDRLFTTVGTQTDISDYVVEFKASATTKSSGKGYPEEEDLKNDSKLLRFYTGLTSYMVLMATFKLVSVVIPETSSTKLSKFQSFILTLMKLRLSLSNYDLGFRFGVSECTVSRMFSKWIEAMDIRMSFLTTWPERECIRKTMPFCFRQSYGLKVTSVIDCFELFIEKPSDLLAKACTWSQYKHYNTAKYLISITPQGVINFISNGWGGRASDKYIVENSGYLRHLLPGDVILADRGFDIADSVALFGATLDIPAFTKGKDQLSAEEVESTRKLANVRIHVERIIGTVRQRFQILSATAVLPKEFASKKNNGTVLLDSTVRVCCALNNICEGIVPFM